MDFQIPIQDVVDGYKREISTLSGRAIMAEAAQGELTRQLTEAQAEIAILQARPTWDEVAGEPDED